MKRLLFRLAALSIVAFLGVLAVAQAQRSLRAKEVPGAKKTATKSNSASQQAAAARLLEKTASAAKANSLPPAQENPYSEVSAPPASRVAPAAHTEPAPYEEVPPAEIPKTAPDPHVLQVVSEAELAPAPSAEGQSLGAEPLPSEPAPLSVDPAAQQQLEAHPEPGYMPGRMTEDVGAYPTDTAAGANEAYPGPAEPYGGEPQPFPQADPSSAAIQGHPAGAAALPTSAASQQAGTGRPGNRELEGAQGASLTVEKIAPPELQVGRNASFQIRVRNAGSIAARDVQIIDEVPARARLASTSPIAETGPSGEIIWNIGRLGPGDETTVSMEIVPLEEGEIGSVAVAHFAAEASARSVATRPQLALQAQGPREVLIGQEARIVLKVSNVGTGAANGVVLLNQLPPNLSHPAGSEVEYTVGNLAPNESREVELSLMAAKPGAVENVIVAMGEGNLRADDRVALEVLAPALDVAIDGSERRFLERQAAYTLTLTNSGTASAKSVELHVRLPDGLQFVEANNLGEFESATRTVHWRLEELPAGESGSVTLVAMPTVEGDQQISVEAKAADGLAVQKTHRALIEGIAGASFEVVDVSDPIEAGGETSYEIRVLNQGTKASANVRVAVVLPSGMQPVDASGPVAHVVDGSQVVFEPLTRLAPKADATYQVRVKAHQPGDMRVRVQLLSEEMQTPVTKEESTRVFGIE